MPPEHSGIRNLPDEPKPPPPTAPVFVNNASRRPTPRAWPFAPGAHAAHGEARRALGKTQLGLGTAQPASLTSSNATSQGPAVPAAQPPAAAASAAIEPQDPSKAITLEMRATRVPSEPSTREQATASAEPAPLTAAADVPAITSIDKEPASDRASGWSPTSTKPQRASLLRASDNNGDAGRYMVRDSAPDYVELAAKATSDTGPLPVPPPPAGAIGAAEDDDVGARARRYTPKQRPAQRRGRLHERGNGASRKDERPETARTLPDIRSTMPGRPHAMPHAHAVLETPTQPKGRPARMSQAPASASAQPPLHVGEASIVVDPRAVTAPPQAQPPPPRPMSQPPFVQPQLSPAPLSQAPPPRRVSQPGPYVPLPADKSGFEAFMREQARANGSTGSRLNWNQQETLLIPKEEIGVGPRAMLDAKSVRWAFAGASAVALIVGAFALLHGGSNVRSVALRTNTSTSAAMQGPITVIATEPSGAELLQGGAVLGNTPMEVPRPSDGVSEFSVRMAGFRPETVRLSPQSKEAIRLTLTPVGTP
jgi:hypothetical protein